MEYAVFMSFKRICPRGSETSHAQGVLKRSTLLLPQFIDDNQAQVWWYTFLQISSFCCLQTRLLSHLDSLSFSCCTPLVVQHCYLTLSKLCWTIFQLLFSFLNSRIQWTVMFLLYSKVGCPCSYFRKHFEFMTKSYSTFISTNTQIRQWVMCSLTCWM